MTTSAVHAGLLIAGVAVAVAGAARSTWSPCGLSMLSSITPLAERGRGHRFGPTAAWFVAGATVGGALLGLVGAALAAAVGALGPAPALEAGAGAFLAAVAFTSDLGPGGRHLPVHHRQVNERWLDQFRPWVYGAGFGLQIGSGLATYVTTAAVYLVVALGALTADPMAALVLGTVFGATRGLAVLFGRLITTPGSLLAFHRRFEAAGPRVRAVTIVVEALAAIALAGLIWVPAGVAAAGVAAAVVAVVVVVVVVAAGSAAGAASSARSGAAGGAGRLGAGRLGAGPIDQQVGSVTSARTAGTTAEQAHA